MGTKCSLLFLGIVGLASVALILQLIGLLTPGWAVLKTNTRGLSWDLEEDFDKEGLFGDDEEMPIAEDYDEIMEKDEMREKRESHGRPPHHSGGDRPPHHGSGPHHGGGRPPHHGRPGHHRPHHHRPGSHGSSGSSEMESEKSSWFSEGEQEPTDVYDDDMFNDDMMSEEKGMMDWFKSAKDVMGEAEIQTNYGLWHSRICWRPLKDQPRFRRDFHDKEKSRDKDGHKKGMCKKVSTHCALSYSFYESPESDGMNKRPRHNKKFASASLAEHRFEACLGLALLVFGLVTAALGFRDAQRYKLVKFASIALMLLAAFVIVVPVTRFAQYSVRKHHEEFPVYVHAPYSVIVSGLAAFFALCTVLISLLALLSMARKNTDSNWRQFENETQQEKKPSDLVFYNDPLPVKPGLYDVCDFSDIKPVEEKSFDVDNVKKADI